MVAVVVVVIVAVREAYERNKTDKEAETRWVRRLL